MGKQKKIYTIEIFTDVLDDFQIEIVVVTDNIEKEMNTLFSSHVTGMYGKYEYYVPGHKIAYARVREHGAEPLLA